MSRHAHTLAHTCQVWEGHCVTDRPQHTHRDSKLQFGLQNTMVMAKGNDMVSEDRHGRDTYRSTSSRLRFEAAVLRPGSSRKLGE